MVFIVVVMLVSFLFFLVVFYSSRTYSNGMAGWVWSCG
jgi:hypothetical protein